MITPKHTPMIIHCVVPTKFNHHTVKCPTNPMYCAVSQTEQSTGH